MDTDFLIGITLFSNHLKWNALKPVECACFDLPECAAMMPTTTPASTTTTEPVPTTTGEADKPGIQINRFFKNFWKINIDITQVIYSKYITTNISIYISINILVKYNHQYSNILLDLYMGNKMTPIFQYIGNILPDYILICIPETSDSKNWKTTRIDSEVNSPKIVFQFFHNDHWTLEL